MNPPCGGSVLQGPYVDVPLTSVSIRWTLVSEQRDRSRGVVRFTVGACDGYAGVTTTDSPTGSEVRVVVTRPFGPVCQPTRVVTEKLRALDVGTLLPVSLQHAPTGPFIAPPNG
jgi:hypothetical protein